MKDPDDDTEMITLIETEEGYEGADLEPGVVTNSMIGLFIDSFINLDQDRPKFW